MAVAVVVLLLIAFSSVHAQTISPIDGAKLYEARFLFEELDDQDSVRMVRGVLDEVARQLTLNRSEAAQ